MLTRKLICAPTNGVGASAPDKVTLIPPVVLSTMLANFRLLFMDPLASIVTSAKLLVLETLISSIVRFPSSLFNTNVESAPAPSFFTERSSFEEKFIISKALVLIVLSIKTVPLPTIDSSSRTSTAVERLPTKSRMMKSCSASIITLVARSKLKSLSFALTSSLNFKLTTPILLVEKSPKAFFVPTVMVSVASKLS